MSSAPSLQTLNAALHAQLARLAAPETKGDALKEELARSKAMSSVAKDIIATGRLALEAQVKTKDYGLDVKAAARLINGA